MRTDTLLGAVVLAACVAPRDPAVAALAAKDPFVQWDRSARLAGDVDGDGEQDLVFVGQRPARVVIGVVRGPASASSEAWLLELPVASAAQGVPVDIAVSFETLAPETNREPRGGIDTGEPPSLRQAGTTRGTSGILVSGGVSRPFHVYWKRTERRLQWWRG